MNPNIPEGLKTAPEAAVETPKETVSAESQEAALATEAEGAEASLQDEITSMEQMMKDMPDMDEDTKAMMQGQIDEMKAELTDSEMRLAPGEPSMKDFKAQLAQLQGELEAAEPKSRKASDIQHAIWQKESQISKLKGIAELKPDPRDPKGGFNNSGYSDETIRYVQSAKRT